MTRNCDLRKIGVRHDFAKNCVQYSIASTMNNCPPNIKCKLYAHSLPGLLLYCKRFFIDSYVVECNIPRCYVCLNTWNNYCVICMRAGTCHYVYVGVHACIYNVCMCMFIYIYVCVWIAPWGWRELNCHFCKVALWHLLSLGGGMIYMCMCEPACIWLCIH